MTWVSTFSPVPVGLESGVFNSKILKWLFGDSQAVESSLQNSLIFKSEVFKEPPSILLGKNIMNITK